MLALFNRQQQQGALVPSTNNAAKSLSEIMSDGCKLLQSLPVTSRKGKQDAERICSELRNFFESHQIPYMDVLKALVEAVGTENNVHEEWIRFFTNPKTPDFNIFPAQQIASTAVQSALTGDANEEIYHLSSDIPKSLATSNLSIFLVGQSGTGKTTLQRALAGLTVQSVANAECMVIDLQANPWLGLQKTHNPATLPDVEEGEEVFHQPNTVTYATPGIDEDMLLVTEAIAHVWTIYQSRVKEKQQMVRAGAEGSQFNPFRLFFNEWNVFYGWAQEFNKQKLSEFRAMAKRKGIKNPLSPMDAVARIGYIFSSGRDINLGCCISGQSIVKTETGFGPSVLANINVVAVGRVSGEDGGYGAPLSIVSDQYRIKDARVRAILSKELDGFIKRNEPVLVSTQGHGGIGKLPDYSSLAGQNMLRIYQHEIK